MLGLSVTQGLVRTEALDEAGALAGVRVQLLLPGPAPLVGACPGVCLLGTADTPGQRCGSIFCRFLPLLWVFLCLQTLTMPWGKGDSPACPPWLGNGQEGLWGAAESNSVKYSFSLIHTNISPLELWCAWSSASV